MGWYTVTKRINGRYYLYLQMTYRQGGKVKTKNKYLGPAASRGASFGYGAPANLPTAEAKPTTPRPPRKPKELKPETPRQRIVRRFKELSQESIRIDRERTKVERKLSRAQWLSWEWLQLKRDLNQLEKEWRENDVLYMQVAPLYHYGTED